MDLPKLSAGSIQQASDGQSDAPHVAAWIRGVRQRAWQPECLTPASTCSKLLAGPAHENEPPFVPGRPKTEGEKLKNNQHHRTNQRQSTSFTVMRPPWPCQYFRPTAIPGPANTPGAHSTGGSWLIWINTKTAIERAEPLIKVPLYRIDKFEATDLQHARPEERAGGAVVWMRPRYKTEQPAFSTPAPKLPLVDVRYEQKASSSSLIPFLDPRLVPIPSQKVYHTQVFPFSCTFF